MSYLHAKNTYWVYARQEDLQGQIISNNLLWFWDLRDRIGILYIIFILLWWRLILFGQFIKSLRGIHLVLVIELFIRIVNILIGFWLQSIFNGLNRGLSKIIRPVAARKHWKIVTQYWYIGWLYIHLVRKCQYLMILRLQKLVSGTTEVVWRR